MLYAMVILYRQQVSKEKAQISKETVKYLGGVSFLRDNEVFLN